MKLKNILSELKVVKSLNEIGEGVTPFPFRRTGSTNVGTWERIMSEYKADGTKFMVVSLDMFQSDSAGNLARRCRESSMF